MGMAASQARFLGLTARKTNVEYEGQQINQQRTALGNQSANYYNQMLGMSVPKPPSVNDFTKTVYSFDDGNLKNTITSLIAQTGGNYLVSYLREWQDDFAIVSAAPAIITATSPISPLETAATAARTAATIPTTGDSTAFTAAKSALSDTAVTGASDVAGVKDALATIKDAKTDAASKAAIQALINAIDTASTPPTTAAEAIAAAETATTFAPPATKSAAQAAAEAAAEAAAAAAAANSFMIGAQRLRLLGSVTTAEIAADPYLSTLSTNGTINDKITALMAQEKAQIELLRTAVGDPAADFVVRYVQNSSTGAYEAQFYNLDVLTSPTTIYDATTGQSQSHIQAYKVGSQQKTEEIKGVTAKLEQDATGRIINITLNAGDTANERTYALTTNTITDQAAYDDAINQYEFNKFQYDQTIQEVNAKIEVIQVQDKNLELRLKQLDTEHNAIQTEMDAVSKVIEKNVESTFKTFG